VINLIELSGTARTGVVPDLRPEQHGSPGRHRPSTCHTFEVAGDWYVHRSNQSIVRLRLAPDDAELLGVVLDGMLDAQEAIARAEAPDRLARAVERLLDQPAEPCPPTTTEPNLLNGPITVVGDPRLSATVGSAVKAALRTPGDSPTALTIACLGWIDDNYLTGLATVHRDLDQPLIGCFTEGDSWFLLPTRTVPLDPDYLDLRLRRLGAAARPELLAAAWRAMAASPMPPPIRNGPATRLGEILAADAVTVLAGRRSSTAGVWAELRGDNLDLATRPLFKVPGH